MNAEVLTMKATVLAILIILIVKIFLFAFIMHYERKSRSPSEE